MNFISFWEGGGGGVFSRCLRCLDQHTTCVHVYASINTDWSDIEHNEDVEDNDFNDFNISTISKDIMAVGATINATCSIQGEPSVFKIPGYVQGLRKKRKYKEKFPSLAALGYHRGLHTRFCPATCTS